MTKRNSPSYEPIKSQWFVLESRKEKFPKKIVTQLDPRFPSKRFEMNWLLCETLSYIESRTVAQKGIKLMMDAPTQEEQMEYARSLRTLKTGWNNQLRTQYFNWFSQGQQLSRRSQLLKIH